MERLILGVDEAGRGPLAGPVAVGVVAAPNGFDFRLLAGVRDSKQMSELGREIWYEKLRVLEQEEGLRHIVVFSSANSIDTYGITRAVRRAVYKGVRTLAPEYAGVKVLLDGLLHAPKEYEQETIIKGDETEPLISLASIAAKVRRDRLMRRLSLRFPEYGFEIHKGYGTKMHREALIKLGLCDIHRKTFCH
ncbi:ribonuclease HII [Acetobacteraceae bacterium]|nr:ribonuclease HII [Candidatus Parcubacteria bacterium]